MPETQTLQNHARIDPLYHRFLLPILLIHLLTTLWNLSKALNWDTVEAFLLAVGLLILGFFARINALRAQDRVIRLEEQLRFERLGIGEKLAGLTMPQVVAVRFASDGEVATLADQIESGKLTTPKEIKAAIQTWRPDHARV